MAYAENLGTAGSALNALYGSSDDPNSNAPTLFSRDDNYVYLPGVANNYLSAPDSAALDITGDIDIRLDVALDDWTPSATQYLIAKRSPVPICYWLSINVDGQLSWEWSPDGINVPIRTSVPVFASPGERVSIRITLDVNDGAGGNITTFYTGSTFDDWTILGEPIYGTGTTSIGTSTAALFIGARTASADMLTGRIYRVQIRSGIDGVIVFDADMNRCLTTGNESTFTEVSDEAATVTINRATTGAKSLSVVEPIWQMHTDDYFDVVDDPRINVRSGEDATWLIIGRRWDTQTNSAAMMCKQDGVAGWTIRNAATGSALAAQVNLYGDTGNSQATGAASTAGELEATVVVRSTGTLTLYRNTIVAESVSDSSGDLINTLPMRLGATSGTAADFFNGEMRAAAMWRRALPVDEIAAILDRYGVG